MCEYVQIDIEIAQYNLKTVNAMRVKLTASNVRASETDIHIVVSGDLKVFA